MNVEKLARMANQIAANCYSGRNKLQAIGDVADHLLRFWTRQMRTELAEGHAQGAVELSEIAALALETSMRPGAMPQMTGTGSDAG